MLHYLQVNISTMTKQAAKRVSVTAGCNIVCNGTVCAAGCSSALILNIRVSAMPQQHFCQVSVVMCHYLH